jgi:hypothetical protein
MSAVLQTPSARLAQSREQLRLSLNPSAAPPAAAGASGASKAHWFDELRALPGVSLVTGVVGQWWARHPLRVAGTLAAVAATAAIRPIAQRHPWAVLGGAFAVGALVAVARPWRWSKAALWTGLLPQLLLATVKAVPAPRPDRPLPPPT